MDNHVGKSQKWQEWQGREIISVNVDRGFSVQKRIGSGVVIAHKQRITEIEQALRPSCSFRDVRRTECPAKAGKPKPQCLLPTYRPEVTKIKKPVRRIQRNKRDSALSSTHRKVRVPPLPPIKRGTESQTSDSPITKPSTKNMVARRAIAATNLYDTSNVSSKDEILFPDLVDSGLTRNNDYGVNHDNMSTLLTKLQSLCKQMHTRPDKWDLERNDCSLKRQNFCTNETTLQPSICNNCTKADATTNSYMPGAENRGRTSSVEGRSYKDIESPPVEAWSNGVNASPVELEGDAQPVSKSGSFAILKLYRDNYPLLMSNLESTRAFPCMPIKCSSPVMVQRLSHRSCRHPTLKVFEPSKDEDATEEIKRQRMRFDIKELRKMLDKERKKSSKP